MNKEFVPYTEALELKQLGFDEPCFGYYEPNGDFNYIESNILKNFPYLAKNSEWKDLCGAPTYSQAFRWFRKKGYDVKVEKESAEVYFGFWWTGVAWSLIEPGTYEEAELACLCTLIKIVKNK